MIFHYLSDGFQLEVYCESAAVVYGLINFICVQLLNFTLQLFDRLEVLLYAHLDKLSVRVDRRDLQLQLLNEVEVSNVSLSALFNFLKH